MSETAETAPRAAPPDRSIEARRAGRLLKARREGRIVQFLNRGVSIAEIAAREGVTEKRMRAVIRDILARRMPAPPAEFLALQMSRLNEALVVAYGAMSGGNLQAVDRVVKIVRELDRYNGFVAAERRLSPGEPRLEAPAESPLALAAPPPACPETAPQTLERVQSAPGIGSAWQSPSPPEADPEASEASPSHAPADDEVEAEAPPTRPEMAPEALDIPKSAPGGGAARGGSNRDDGMESMSEASAETSLGAAPPLSPEMAPEALDCNESAPGNGAASEALTQVERELASGMYAAPSTGPDGARRVTLRATPNGVMAA